MSNQINYEKLRERLVNIIKTAKKLGLNIIPGGGYAMGYSITNLPNYAVGLIGALSIIEGEGARSKLGLTFEQTVALEDGFNGMATKQKRKRKITYPELAQLGFELTNELYSYGLGVAVKKKSLFANIQTPAPGAWRVDGQQIRFETPGTTVQTTNFDDGTEDLIPRPHQARVAAGGGREFVGVFPVRQEIANYITIHTGAAGLGPDATNVPPTHPIFNLGLAGRLETQPPELIEPNPEDDIGE